MDLGFRKIQLERSWNLPCALCGGAIASKQAGTEIETREEGSRQPTLVRVWHRLCYDRYLDDGEEV